VQTLLQPRYLHLTLPLGSSSPKSSRGLFYIPLTEGHAVYFPPHTMSSKRPSCRFHYLTTKGRKVTKPEKKANKNLKRMPFLPLWIYNHKMKALQMPLLRIKG
jgi:hypothetical protein